MLKGLIEDERIKLLEQLLPYTVLNVRVTQNSLALEGGTTNAVDGSHRIRPVRTKCWRNGTMQNPVLMGDMVRFSSRQLKMIVHRRVRRIGRCGDGALLDSDCNVTRHAIPTEPVRARLYLR